MNYELIDSHTHLDAKDFDSDREEVIKRAQAAGVTRIVTIGAGYGMESAHNAVKIAQQHNFIWATAGVHPHDAKTEPESAWLEELLAHPKVVAVGETGLDFYRDWAPRDTQEKWFIRQIELARKFKKPLVIHSREAGQDCLKILIEHKAHEVGGVFHCYAEDQYFAQQLLPLNFLVSFPGSLTFKKAEKLRQIASAIPLSQIMVETDAPYLAPEPLRGKRCETSFIVETVKMLAKIKALSFEEVAQTCAQNAIQLYKLPERI